MGMGAGEFERMSYGEFMCRFNGFTRQKEEALSSLRMVMWSAIAPHSKKKLKPEDIIKLPSERRPKKVEYMTKERFNELKEKWLTRN